MSFAQFVANIQMPAQSPSGSTYAATQFNFSIARITSGAVPDRTYVELEELTTPGVDGRRWRQLRNYFPTFTMETWADFSSYTKAVAECRNYWLSQGQFVTLLWKAADFQAQYFQVKVINIDSQAMAGILNGFGADTNSAAIVHGNWTLAVQAIEGTQPA